ncbi:DNA ligase [Bacillus aquiflavi]|uniref:ATP-dependent DNA ligase n=1 Tax=Bacillus aquiflavi TaxID=2672567 RepID=UPI001CA9AFE0|nr:RNA ligase family protein [Bacillus aquiflavi]UAC49693.1 DNA ligase [Bacillus aquiflavi]
MKFNPIIPFEPIPSDKIPLGAEWISQVKWDGVRVLTNFDGQEVKLFNRKLNERTNIFPELTKINSYTSAKSVILDGEVVALGKDGKPSFHEVMKRDGIRRIDRVKAVMNTVPIYYMIFDVVFYNGNWMHNEPLKERLNVLSKIIEQNEHIQIVPIQDDGHTLFEVVKQYNLEGIVCKNMNSKYVINGKNANWQKIKNYKDMIAVIGGVTYRSGIVNSILLGLYNEHHQLLYIGHAGTGKLTAAEWQQLTKIIEPLKINNRPFINEPERMHKVQWLQPALTVKVQYIEWPEGRSLRQPSIQAFVDQDPKKCTLNE